MPNKVLPLSLGVVCAFELVLASLHAADEPKKVDISKVPPASAQKGLSFEKDVKPILDKSCAKCHSGDKPKGKYRMDTLASIMKGGESGDPAVVPGQGIKSPLVLYPSDAVQDMEMPPTEKRDKYPPLTKEQIAILRAWIEQGAKK